jgi:zinc protease
MNRTKSFPLAQGWPQARLLVVLATMFACHPTTPPKSHPESVVSPAKPVIPRVSDAWRSKVPTAAQDSPWTYPEPKVFSLANRVTVYVLQRQSGPVSLSLVVKHGASDVPFEQSGLAQLTAQLMAEATKTKNHYVLSEMAESLGSTLTAGANRDYIHVLLDTLPEDASTGISLLAETLTGPAFRRDDFDRLRKQLLDDLAAERQEPSRLASLVGLQAALGPEQGAPVSGRLSSVQRLTLSEVRQWHKSHVYPEAVALLVVGPVAPEDIRMAAERSLGTLRGKPAKTGVVAAAGTIDSSNVYCVDRTGSVQSALFIAQVFPRRNAPGYAARQLLDNVLGGQFTSRINQNLREQHAYTYGARSAAVAARQFGLLTIATSVETGVTAPAIREILKELREVRGPNSIRPIATEEFERARTGVIQRLGAHLEDGHHLASDLEQVFVHDLAPDYMRSYLTEVRSLDSVDVSAESERIAPDHLAIVMVGDLNHLRPQLAEAGLHVIPVPTAWLD